MTFRDARRLLNTFQQDAFSTSLNEFAYRYLEHQTGAEGRLLDEGFQIAWTLRLSLRPTVFVLGGRP